MTKEVDGHAKADRIFIREDRRLGASWPWLLMGLVVTTIVALSVHAVMLEGLHVPYPYSYPHHGWPAFPDMFAVTVAAIYTLSLLDYRFQRLPTVARWLMFFLLLATIKESLFRAAFMEIMNSNSFIYPVVEATPRIVLVAIIAACAVLSAPFTKSHWSKWMAALIISALVFFCCKPVIDTVFGSLLTRIAWMSTPSLYDPPYDYHILIPAYLSFLEPVFASFFMVALTWAKLPGATTRRLIVFTLLVWGLKGPVFSPFINIHFAHVGAGMAMLSEGQFSFESIALGVLTALTWSGASTAEARKLS